MTTEEATPAETTPDKTDTTPMSGSDSSTTDEMAESEPTSTAMVAVSAERMEMQNVAAWARMMTASNFFPDTQSAAQCAVKILAGRELGFSTVASMTGVHIIDGKPTMGAHLLAAALKRSPKYDYRVGTHNDQECTIHVLEMVNGSLEQIGDATFTIADAQAAGLMGRKGQMWEKYPRNMLFARAISNAITWFAPDVFEGARVYTPDEVRADIELDASGEVLDLQSLAVPPRGDDEPVRAAAGHRQSSSQPSRPETGEGSRATPPRRGRRPEPAIPDDPREIIDLAMLLRWAHENFAAQPADIAEILDVESTADINKWKDQDGFFEEAVDLIRGHYADGEQHGNDEPDAPTTDT